ncbi:MAG: LysE family translocator [Anaerolineaceae bacterium]|nr:LysE family translocator [Anaerolineaceae bacterium]
MLDTATLTVFMAAALALLLIPGPAVLYIVARSIDQGRAAGIVSAFGVGIGTLFHVAAAALGLSALLLSSALAFSMVKYLGAAYLVYLGIQKLRERNEPQQVEQPQSATLRQIFSQGIVVNLLNPKLALFFFAFLPQFVNPARGSVAIQSLLLGLIFVALGIGSDSFYALLAGTLRQWLRGSRAFARGQRYFAGCVYILLGVTTALSGSKQS